MTDDSQPALIEDELNRRRALDFASFIVEAPAGAGKTELLTQRYLKLLQSVDEPEEIIAVTFTNKAAAEMRLRILDSLLGAATGNPPEAPHKKTTYDLSLQALKKSQTHDWHLLENPARLRIFTIDGLCAYLARQMPLMSRFGSQPAIAEDPANHYALAAERTLGLIEDKAHGDIIRQALRYLDNDAGKFKKLLLRMLSMRDQWLHHAQLTISEAELQSTLCDMISAELIEISSVIDASMQSALMPLVRFAANNLANNDSIALLRDWNAYLPTNAESLGMWQALGDLLLIGSGNIRKTVTVNNGFPKEAKQQKQDFIALLNELAETAGAQQAIARIRLLPGVKDNEQSWQMIATLSKLLNLAAAELWLVFQQAKEVDFVEIAKRATEAFDSETLDAIETPSELALRLDYQIKHLLVDEFQDTSPSQIALIEKLTAGWQEDDGRTLFCVGDPMQSIYRFRKANVGLFLHAATHGIGDIHLHNLRLTRNNRSCPPIVEWINRAFQPMFAAEDNTAKGTIRYRPFVATKVDEPETGITIHPVIKQAGETVEMAKKREAQAIIDIILHEQATHPERKIAILVRAKAHLQTLVTELRRNHKNVRFQAVEIEALANRQIVQDMLALTCALHHRADRVNWLAVLRAPWCGLTLQDLHALAGNDTNSTIWSLMQSLDIVTTLSEDGQQRLRHIRDIFEEAFAVQGRMNISRWIRGVWLMLSGASCLWEESDVVDVQAFFSCVEELDRNNQFSLERLNYEIGKLFAAPDTAGEMLQMMTIHKSKGLEFDTVILPGLGNSTGGNDEQAFVLWEEIPIETPHGLEMQLLAAPLVPKAHQQENSVSPYDYLNSLEKERTNNEDARVLYVAATRAELKLHLVGTANQNNDGDINPTKNSYLDMLWPALSHAFVENIIPAHSLSENDLSTFIPSLVRLSSLHVPRELVSERPPVQTNTRKQKHEEEEKDIHTAQTLVGVLVHLYLEIIAKQDLAEWSPIRIANLNAAMQHWLQQQGLNLHDAQNASKQVQRLLNMTLSSEQGQWVLKSRESAASELEIEIADHIQISKKIIDRTFIENGTRWIIDYKSTSFAPSINEASLQSAAEEYRVQLEEYAQLFANQRFPIRKAVLFLSTGRLVELV